MSKKIGKCALCDDKEIKLVDSHIIPKLVYKRIKSKKNSRFRNYYNIKDIFQDGEKKPMLCASCEKFFNSFETPYANYILDPYIKHGDRRNKIDELLNNYIYSLN